MDQIKTGKFIQEMRKRKNLTQRQLAEMLGISDKTISKWETGNGLPEVGLMPDLCTILEISVNELLAGQKLNKNQYFNKAEENMINLMSENNEAKKKLVLSIIVGIIAIIAGTPIILIAGILEMQTWVRIILIMLAIIIYALGIGVACVLDRDAGTFECPNCGKRFVPTMKEYVMGPHTITKRKLRCPHCGKKSFCKKRITR